MENKLFLSEEKVLEHNEKCFKDTMQLFENVNKDAIENLIKRIGNDPEFKSMCSNVHFYKGRTIWLELKVEDSYLSGLISSWMYSESNHDGKSGLQALGCTLQSILFSKPIGYTDDVKQAIKKLHDDAFGNK